MAHYLCIILFCCCTFLSKAQKQEAPTTTLRYSWVEDQDFTSSADFYGYTFVPGEGKMSIAHYPDPIGVGVVSFSVTRADVLITERANYTPAGIVDPPTDAKPYRLRISRIVETDFGVEFYLVDHTNRELEGYLKFYRDPISQVEMIKYRPSMADPEHVYWLSHISEEQALADGQYFTHQEDFNSKTLEELWGKVLYPFLSYSNQSNINIRQVSRIYQEDAIDVRFEEETVLKGKKEKLLQYIIFNPKDGKRRKFLIKKIKEVESYQDREENKPRTVLEAEVKDETTQENFFVLFHRGKRRLLRAIELQDEKTRESLLYYEMRRGKGIITEEPPKTSANEDAPTVD
ncbi:MAG: hypothetical protein ACRBFS_09025 [Aureispira sp.]